MQVTGIILAGGKSVRMGTDKGLVIFKGIPMIQHVLHQLERMHLPIIIVSNNDAYAQFGVPVVKDLVEAKGPVGGIYTALQHSSTEFNVIVSCDIPFVNKELIEVILAESAESDVTISSFEGREHPLIGVYKKSTTAVFKANLDKGQLKLMEVINTMRKKVVEFSDTAPTFDARAFNNINTKEALTKFEG